MSKDKVLSLLKRKRLWMVLISVLSAAGVVTNPELGAALVELLPDLVNVLSD